MCGWGKGEIKMIKDLKRLRELTINQFAIGDPKGSEALQLFMDVERKWHDRENEIKAKTNELRSDETFGEWITIKGAMSKYGRSYWYFNKYAENGAIKTSRIGKMKLLKDSDIKRLIKGW